MNNPKLTNWFLLMIAGLLCINIWATLQVKEKPIHDMYPTSEKVEPQKMEASVPVAVFCNYTVKQGDCLSCISGSRWKDIASDNNLVNPDLIYPGQILKIREGIVLSVAKKPTARKIVTYCNIGADPVLLNKSLSEGETEHTISENLLVTMGTGSGKTVTCVLKAGEVVVVRDFPTSDGNIERVATWVRKCGNPLINKVIVATPQPTIQEVKKVKVERVTWGLYENPDANKSSIPDSN